LLPKDLELAENSITEYLLSLLKTLDTRVLSAKIDFKPRYIDCQIKKPFIG